MPDIYFYDTGSDWDIFTNTVGSLPIDVVIGDHHYTSTSTEGIFQGLKYIAPDINPNQLPGKIQDVAQAQRIMNMPAGAGQQKAGGKHSLWYNIPGSKPTIPDPNTLYNILNDHDKYPDGTQLSFKERLMYDLIKMKSTQHIGVMKALLSTGSDQIIENTRLASYDDDFWGNGWSWNGRNALGKLWMMLRAEINSELAQNHDIPVQLGFSDGVSAAFHIAKSVIKTLPNKVVNKALLDAIPHVYNKAKDLEQFHQTNTSVNLGGEIDAELTKLKHTQTSVASTAINPMQTIAPAASTDDILEALYHNFDVDKTDIVSCHIDQIKKTLTITSKTGGGLDNISAICKITKNNNSIILPHAHAESLVKSIGIKRDVFASTSVIAHSHTGISPWPMAAPQTHPHLGAQQLLPYGAPMVVHTPYTRYCDQFLCGLPQEFNCVDISGRPHIQITFNSRFDAEFCQQLMKVGPESITYQYNDNTWILTYTALAFDLALGYGMYYNVLQDLWRLRR